MKSYGTREVADLLGLSPARVRSYARAGFLKPGRGPGNRYRFSFQDLVLLRAAKGLLDARVPARRVRRALAILDKQLPSGVSLSEVRITADSERVVVRHGGIAWNPESGQLQLDFEVSELAGRIAPLAAGAARAAESGNADADEWFELALELEAYAPAEALTAYQRVLERDPEHADAHLNLGRLLHEAGRPERAEFHYRRALESRPDDATAAFNLGVALEDAERWEDAIAAYEHALRLDKALADAHFNLARLREVRGNRREALAHLRSYRALTRRRGSSRRGSY
ncbi:MAG TPA: tetratricopeptide repeat protein [Longimicrobiales bacterium]|nr:tetratricopeptide repeat protein [Longimicrobiales bacterium]